MSEVLYFLSVMLVLTAYAVGGWLMWKGVELVYWIYCKMTGKTY
jgi:hypothetical protein